MTRDEILKWYAQRATNPYIPSDIIAILEDFQTELFLKSISQLPVHDRNEDSE